MCATKKNADVHDTELCPVSLRHPTVVEQMRKLVIHRPKSLSRLTCVDVESDAHLFPYYGRNSILVCDPGVVSFFVGLGILLPSDLNADSDLVKSDSDSDGQFKDAVLSSSAESDGCCRNPPERNGMSAKRVQCMFRPGRVFEERLLMLVLIVLRRRRTFEIIVVTCCARHAHRQSQTCPESAS